MKIGAGVTIHAASRGKWTQMDLNDQKWFRLLSLEFNIWIIRISDFMLRIYFLSEGLPDLLQALAQSIPD